MQPGTELRYDEDREHHPSRECAGQRDGPSGTSCHVVAPRCGAPVVRAQRSWNRRQMAEYVNGGEGNPDKEAHLVDRQQGAVVTAARRTGARPRWRIRRWSSARPSVRSRAATPVAAPRAGSWDSQCSSGRIDNRCYPASARPGPISSIPTNRCTHRSCEIEMIVTPMTASSKIKTRPVAAVRRSLPVVPPRGQVPQARIGGGRSRCPGAVRHSQSVGTPANGPITA